MFEKLFVRTVGVCVEAGLVDGSKIHVDGSVVDADASKDSVVKGSPELVGALKEAYRAQEGKLEWTEGPEAKEGEGQEGRSSYARVNDKLVSTTDADAAMVRQGKGESRPRYKHHRGVDDAEGVITAVESTPGDVAENE